MGLILGALFGAGILLLWRSASSVGAPPRPVRRPMMSGLGDLLAAAGFPRARPGWVVAASVGSGVLAFVIMLAVSRTVPIALVFGVLALTVPRVYLRSRRRRRQADFRELWPEVLDNLSSAVRAGMSLPEALGQLGVRGPEGLRAPFEQFAADFRSSGRFSWCLDRLKHRLANPTGDRLVETLRVTRDVGGSELGSLLRTLAAFLRDDARVRAELEARQSWTVNGARVAVAAPWIVLALLSTQPQAARAYNSPTGWLVLAGGALACLAAYRLMLRIGRLPEEERVLR